MTRFTLGPNAERQTFPCQSWADYYLDFPLESAVRLPSPFSLLKVPNHLRIPDNFYCQQRSVSDGIEGLCMLLRRLSYPCWYGDMLPRFTRLKYGNKHGSWLYLRYPWAQNHTVMSPAQLQVYTNAVSAKGSPLENCFGFIDGKFRPICRPRENQRVVYNGHKRVHALKFQSVTLPNGIIGNMYGPVAIHLIVSRVPRNQYFFSLPYSAELRTEFRTLPFLALFVELYFSVTFIFQKNGRNG